jgi:hypothetical protein
VTSWLVDTSALVRIGTLPDPEPWSGALVRGLLHVSTVTLLELGYSAPNGESLRRARTEPPLSLLTPVHLTPAMEDRALDVQQVLADRGHHRAPSVPELLVAATAEVSGLTVLHVDKDFDLIASVTGQPVARLA